MKGKLFLASALALAAAAAAAAPVGIASGAETGTNWPMARDIAAVCSTADSPINNVVTAGGLENVFKVYSDRSSQYGIVPLDALEYQRGQDANMMSKIQVVFPFFSVEMHLVAKDGSPIRSLADLQGKRVVEGPEGSGTWVSVQVIKALTRLQWTPIQASQQDGFNQVMAGQADAEFIVAGKPIKMLQQAAGFKLVPMTHPALDGFKMYTKTMIEGGLYPAARGATPTYKVDNALVTFAFKAQYQTEIASLVSCITRNMGTLQTDNRFHPKWRDVEPTDINRIQWAVHPAALRAINAAKR